jgi:hypothetical protein
MVQQNSNLFKRAPGNIGSTGDAKFAKRESEALPPLINELNQAQIDAQTAQGLREAAQERRDKKSK